MDDGGDVLKNPNEMVGGSVLGNAILPPPLDGKTSKVATCLLCYEKKKKEKKIPINFYWVGLVLHLSPRLKKLQKLK